MKDETEKYPEWLCLSGQHPDAIFVPFQWCNVPRWRMLGHLVASVPDSITIERQGDSLTHLPKDPRTRGHIPWQNQVGALVVHHFKPELLLVLPQGRCDITTRPYGLDLSWDEMEIEGTGICN